MAEPMACEDAHGSDAETEVVLDLTEEESDDETQSAKHVRRGGDMQGIPWSRLPYTRAHYRQERLAAYRNYVNCPDLPHDALHQECAPLLEDAQLFTFRLNSRVPRSQIVHFQLRNLVWATSHRDVYFAIEGGVQHWDAVRRVSSRALELERGVQVSTLAARQDVGLLAAGGFAGEMVVKNLHTGAQGRPWAARQGGVHSSRLSADDDAITNAIHIAPIGPGGAATALLASNNDGLVRSFDADSMKEASKWRLPWAVNFSCLSPCARTALCVGDDTDALLVDARSGGVAARLEGHLDYNFAAAWHPDGTQFVTGSQDRTCRVWDLRQLQRARRVLAGRLGAVRSLRYSDDGAFLAMAEAADFVSLLDVGADYGRAQALDFFGEVAGVSFSPNDAQSFFVGVADLTYGSLLEFQRADPQQRFISL